MQAEGDVEVAGRFSGDIITKGRVVLRADMQGNITADSFQLMGCRLVGNVTAAHQVTLDSLAWVKGNINAGELISSGMVKGDLVVKGNIALLDGATVEGNITTKSMTMSQGAVIDGSVKMGKD